MLGGIAIVRSVAASGAEVETLRAIGFTRRQTTTAAAARPAAAVVAGVGGAAVIAWLLSGRYPIGVGRQGEPSPGRHADLAILPAGVAVLVLVGVAAALLAAWRVGRPRPIGGVPLGSRSGGVGATDLPLPMTMGARLALERRPGVGGRSATAALTFGVTAVAAALTFGAGLDRGSQDGRLSGQSFDTYTVRVGAADVPTDAVAAWRDDGRVVVGDPHRQHRHADRRIGRSRVFALTDLKGRFDDHPLRGRIPAAPDEISFAPTEMRRLGLDVGDTVELGGRTMHVVGEVFTPQAGHTNYDEGARVAPATLDALVAAGDPVKFDSIVIDAAPGVPVEQYGELWHGVEGDVGGRVEAQRNLSPTRLLPRLLAGFVVILTIGATGYAIASTARRRRREVAVLQVLGLTRRQARATVGWHAAIATLVAIAIGVPLGFAIGRTLWQALAEDLPIRYVRPDVTLALLAVGGGVVIAAARARAAPGPHDGARRAGDPAEGRVSRTPARHGGLVAGAALVVATTWVTAATALLAHWPSSRATIGVVAAVAAVVVGGALVVARRWPRARDVRAAIADRVLVGARDGDRRHDAVRRHRPRPRRPALRRRRPTPSAPASSPPSSSGLLLGPAVRRIVAWSRRIVYGSEGPRHELLDQFAHGLTRATALDEVLVQLVETVRPACAADAAEVWLQRDGALVLAQSRPVQRAGAVPLDPTRRAAIARAGVSGDGWAASWLPELRRGDDHVRVAPLAVQGELLGVLVARRGDGADDFDDADDEGLAPRRAPRRRRPAERRARCRAAAHRRRAAPQQRRPAGLPGPHRHRRRRRAAAPRARPPRRRPVPPDGDRRQGAAGPGPRGRRPGRRGRRADRDRARPHDGERPAALARPRHLPATAAHRRAGRRPAGGRRPRADPRRDR